MDRKTSLHDNKKPWSCCGCSGCMTLCTIAALAVIILIRSALGSIRGGGKNG